jgi:hypothetical protein
MLTGNKALPALFLADAFPCEPHSRAIKQLFSSGRKNF